MLSGKRVVLGVTGSIACYKALDLASKLTQAGALVDTIMTRGATQFVTPLAFRSLTHRPVVTDAFDADSEYAVEHVELARQADVIVVAPATVHTIAKLAMGMADDPLTTTVVASKAPLLVAPAMDADMFEHPATQENLERLRQRGAVIAGPGQGRLASGLIGWGRLLETPELLGYIAYTLGRDGDLKGRTVVVSAGGTAEPIDPVRVITNHSSGKMGYAIAEAARDRGANVVLVSAAKGLPNPPLVDVVSVSTAQQMCDAVLARTGDADALIMAAAVADYRPAVRRRSENQEIRRRPDHPPSQDGGHPGDSAGKFRARGIRRREREPGRERPRQGQVKVAGLDSRQRHHQRGQRVRHRHQPRNPDRPRHERRGTAPADEVRSRQPHPRPGGPDVQGLARAGIPNIKLGVYVEEKTTTRLPILGPTAVGIIAIGQNAVGIVAAGLYNSFGIAALSLLNAMGLVAFGPINAMGLVAIGGVNAMGLVAIGGVNAVGVVAIAGVNATGVIAIGGVDSNSALPLK